MEALIILLGEFLLVPVFAGLSALATFVSSLVGLIAELLLGRKRSPKTEQSNNPAVFHPRVIKWFCRITLGILSLFLVALLLINFAFLDSVLRFVADKVEEKSDIRIDYTLSEGNLFTGRFSFSDLKLQRSNAENAFTAEAKTIEADLPITRLIFGSREIDSLRIADAHIEYPLPARAKEEHTERSSGIEISIGIGDKQVKEFNITTRPKLLDTPHYKISDLQLERISVKVIDQSATEPATYDLEIKDMHTAPLRSHYVIFDALFRTNLNATLNGSELTIVNTEQNAKRYTQWATSNVPAEALASLVGGPFSLFESGSIDVEVHEEWEVEQINNLSTEWVLRVRDAKAALPSSTPTALKPLARVFVNNINANPQEWEFGFELELSEGQFHGASSLNALQIWESSIPVILKQIAYFSGFEQSQIKETTEKAFDKFKDFLKGRKQE